MVGTKILTSDGTSNSSFWEMLEMIHESMSRNLKTASGTSKLLIENDLEQNSASVYSGLFWVYWHSV